MEITKKKFGQTLQTLEGNIEVKSLYFECHEGLATLDQITMPNLEEISIGEGELKVFPPFIASLKQLKVLKIADNKIEVLPDWITTLEALEVLDVHNNEITGVPKSIGKLKKLKELDLAHNKISLLPKSISELSELTMLDLAHNRFSKIPMSIFQLTKLEGLSFEANKIGKVPKEIGQLVNMISLSIKGNNIEELPNEVKFLQKLSYFYFGNNTFKSFPEVTAYLPLKELSFHWEEFRSSWIDNYPKLGPSMTMAKLTSKERFSVYKIFENRGTHKVEELLNLMKVNNMRLNKRIMARLAIRHAKLYEANPLTVNQGNVAVLGATKIGKSVFRKKFERLGIGLSYTIQDNTTHVILGQKIITYDKYDKEGLIYIDEKIATDFLIKNRDNSLVKDENTKEKYDKLSGLLLSEDAENVELALNILEDGGAPEELLTELLLAHKNPSVSNKFRRKARALLIRYAPQDNLGPLLVQGHIIDPKIKRATLERNLGYIEKGGLDNKVIGAYVFKMVNVITHFWFRNLTREERAEVVNELIQNPALNMSVPLSTFFLDLEELLTFTDAPYVQIRKEALTEIPKALLKFKNLKKLDLKSNKLRSLPDGFAKLVELQELNIASNHFREFPAVLEQLPNLKSVNCAVCPFVGGNLPDSKVFKYRETAMFERK